MGAAEAVAAAGVRRPTIRPARRRVIRPVRPPARTAHESGSTTCSPTANAPGGYGPPIWYERARPPRRPACSAVPPPPPQRPAGSAATAAAARALGAVPGRYVLLRPRAVRSTATMPALGNDDERDAMPVPAHSPSRTRRPAGAPASAQDLSGRRAPAGQMSRHFPSAVVTGTALVARRSVSPPDAVRAAAVRGHADVIVTENVKDSPWMRRAYDVAVSHQDAFRSTARPGSGRGSRPRPSVALPPSAAHVPDLLAALGGAGIRCPGSPQAAKRADPARLTGSPGTSPAP